MTSELEFSSFRYILAAPEPRINQISTSESNSRTARVMDQENIDITRPVSPQGSIHSKNLLDEKFQTMASGKEERKFRIDETEEETMRSVEDEMLDQYKHLNKDEFNIEGIISPPKTGTTTQREEGSGLIKQSNSIMGRVNLE